MGKHNRAELGKRLRNLQYALRHKQRACKECGHKSNQKARCKVCGGDMK